MNAYSIALYVHLLSLLISVAATALAFDCALRIRAATDASEILGTLGRIRSLVKAFPLATLGLLGTGAFMTQTQWTWTTPWILASIAGLALISVLGSVVEGGRMKMLAIELATYGLTARARRLQRDPVAWTAKMGTKTVLLAVILIMTTKPEWPGCIAMLLIALVLAVPAAMPFWRSASSVADQATA